MNRYARDRNELPKPHQVQKAELSERHFLLRLIAAVALCAVAAIAFTYCFQSLVSTEKGWQTISTNSEELDCGQDFTFYYNIGASEMSARVEKNGLTNAYTDACVNAYRWFNVDQSYEGVVSVYDINQNPNTVLTIDPALYQAFELLSGSDSRLLYYGPLYEVLENLYTCDADAQAKELDPVYDSDTAEYFSEVLRFANDADSIQIELLGENQIRLKVSDEYLSYAADAGIERYIDFFAMKNAFIADYIADTLIEAGYTQGILSSYDGYTRSLDGGASETAFPLYDRIDNQIIQAASVSACGINAAVSLHAFPVDEAEEGSYYVYTDGTVRTPYLGTDGLSHCAVPELIAVSGESSCAELLLQVLPYYTADDWDPSAVTVLKTDGVCTIYCEQETIKTNIDGVSFTDLYDKDGIAYQIGN